MKYEIITEISLTPIKLGRRVALNSPQRKASEAGEIRYQGNPCKYGHNGIRYTNNGQCVQCRAYKPTGQKAGGKPNPVRLLALQNGEEFYISTNPCKRGHVGKRYTKTSLCFECKEHRRWIRKPRERSYSLAKFKITVKQYNELLEKQNFVCAICEGPEQRIDHKTGKLKLLSVDHCHDTNKVRGLLCSQCNLGIGNLRHNSEWLRKAALYCEAV